MTIAEFLVELEGVKTDPLFKLVYLHDQAIRIFDANNVCHCPITAVARRKGFFEVSVCNWRMTAFFLGISCSDRSEIISASDYALPPATQPLRVKILEALGL